MKNSLASHIAPISQEYALLYCQYGPEKGNRDWKQLLEKGGVKALDIQIARKVMEIPNKQHLSRGIIYYGSPYCQTLETEVQKLEYVNRILERVQYQPSLTDFVEKMLTTHLNYAELVVVASATKMACIKGIAWYLASGFWLLG
ncbi:hypothetical protein [Gloeothece verrucosa]|uniref:Uncharacterized protein n=1 Tax=Gloeothece verrucosa (strain PCC 7822) TaxID=497965 RepID=E0UN93_GLOV7|nr:hypothetical protein [Gloeothece verrucosa]ADN18423.1 hypothetical protein Cyan7822_6747 [Gloeothece verrucosa PCC 7822]